MKTNNIVEWDWQTLRQNVRVVAFDADDTLWDCQTYFDHVTSEMCAMLKPWADRQTAEHELIVTEKKNLPLTGYGCKAYILSVIETAIRVSSEQISASEIARLLWHSRGLLNLPATPLPEVEQTLTYIRTRIDESHLPLRLAVFTKGDLLNQRHKLERSGLAGLFDHVEISADKQTADFERMCRRMDIGAAQLLMVGNSLRSDIAPLLSLGGWGIHVPFHAEWEIEHSEEFEHSHLRRITHFGSIKNMFDQIFLPSLNL